MYESARSEEGIPPFGFVYVPNPESLVKSEVLLGIVGLFNKSL